ncbi:MAG TPA: type II CAAX endopeptidase family protein [Ignavibacteriaceae bacterium]|jgi:membrane protease YdiL (CAAX protease family)|nr:type II CAAX endopeptidase family protein [Ignavibacteriaceae bacterium]
MEKSNRVKSMLWGAVKVISYIILVQLFQRIVILPLASVSRSYWSELDGRGLNEPWFLSTGFAIFLVAVVITAIFLKFIEKTGWVYIRLTFDKYSKKFNAGAAIALLIVILFTILNLVLSNTQLIINYSSFTSLILYIIILMIGILLLVAHEEIMYRGYILRTFEKHYNTVTAVILSSLLFSLAHSLRPDISPLSFINIFLAGAFLSILCINYNSIWLPLGFHFGWNYFLWLFNYPISGQRYTNPLFKLEYSNHNLVTGSEFGPEDSIVMTVLLAAITGYTLYKHKRKHGKTRGNGIQPRSL